MAALDFPASPSNGDTFGNWIYNSSKLAWQSKPLTPAKTVNSPTAPTSPADGDQWFNTNTGQLFIYYTDANGSQWVESRAPITADGYISPNYIINGAFDFWQRGTSATNNTGYLADRWYITQNATGVSSNQSRVTTTLQGKLGYALRLSAGANATSIVEWGVRQVLERGHIETLAGKTVTLSFWYRSNKTGTHGARIIGLGTGAVDFTAGFTVSTADTWQRYSITTSAPYGSITAWSTTNPADIGSYVDVGFKAGNSGPGFTSISTNDYFEVTGIQLEEGSVATPFRRSAGTLQGELAACQRYYIKAVGSIKTPYNIFNSGNCQTGSIYFPVTMRTNPVITVYDTAGTAGKVTIANAGGTQQTNITPPAAVDAYPQWWGYNSGGMGGTTGSNGMMFFNGYDANAEF